MSHVRRQEPGHPPSYHMACDWPGCTEVHEPTLTSRSASDARLQARTDGWRAPNAAKNRKADKLVDLCPAHRGATR